MCLRLLLVCVDHLPRETVISVFTPFDIGYAENRLDGLDDSDDDDEFDETFAKAADESFSLVWCRELRTEDEILVQIGCLLGMIAGDEAGEYYDIPFVLAEGGGREG